MTNETDHHQWRDVETGEVIEEVCRAKLQGVRDVVEGEILVVYRGEDGKVWARQEDAFEEGERYEKVRP